ncbi:oxidase ustYa family protein [Aspergillus brunneoviolaceus CBS 621.78]|uniref:Uncharacterized protein n=1 Tax=Aspergillus brunneoviolaceus CBS 621.78 TaxID=1450534 RepID=A0ACD1GIM5_9EURO|nr:hypothetical protein BO95DRAFT_450842 [Aspergillus brunneoviolaceus CBS 621.78]RAH48964.1 hypothetical protein BO95DRAFT_450842 [Aspergillus brunneoviolaceus CBS 621.78]
MALQEYVAEPLLAEEERARTPPLTCPSFEKDLLTQAPKRSFTRRFAPWLIHLCILLSYKLLTLAIVRHALNDRNEETRPALPLPDREGLQWRSRRFPTNIVDNPLAGTPRPELESAWHDLLQNDNIRVPIGYLQEKSLKSVYTQDHTEGIVSLSVYHSLHCLWKHADHCVEYIRESLMCQPDLALVTFRWINDTAQHAAAPTEFYPTNFDVDVHRCADWESLDRWAGQRAFDLSRVDLLDRPLGGLEWEMEKGQN